MGYQKLSADINKEDMKVINRAIKIVQRSRANFVRLCCLKEAIKIVKENTEKN